MSNKEINADYINNLSYTDFVWLINQWNVLPWSFTTLSKWINYSFLNKNSNILEIACTTWFSSREISNLTWCTWIWIDISEKSILSARKNQELYTKNSKIKYKTKNAYEFESDEKFSHIIVWAALKFFPDQKLIIEKIVSLLEDWWFLLASPFYIEKDIPEYLVNKAKKVFWITITTEKYKEIMNLYNKFEIIYENRSDLVEETLEEIEYYAESTTNRAIKDLNIDNIDTKNAIFNRLVEIKTMSNELRPYQKYTVLVLRYRKDIYPNRFIELF